jgi:hypothetical protein
LIIFGQRLNSNSGGRLENDPANDQKGTDMAKRRKTIRMTVEVTVPAWCTASQARRVVRESINYQGFDYWLEGPNLEEGRVKARAVKAAAR